MNYILKLLTLLAVLHLASSCGAHQASTAGIQEHLQRRSANITIPRRIALTNVRYFNDDEITAPTTVIIDGPRTGLIGAGQTVPVDQEIDCTGKVLLPGLFDSHTHPTNIDNFKNLTRFGITTTIGAACTPYPVCAQLKNLPGLASFITAGGAATSPNIASTLFPGGAPPDFLVSDRSDVPSFVANALGNGSELIKIRADIGGHPEETIDAIVDEAHKYGVFAMIHAVNRVPWEQAVSANPDIIHHPLIDNPLSDDMVQSIVDQGIVNVPTLTIIRAFVADGKYTESEYQFAALNTKKLYDAGVTVLAGTDAHVQIAQAPIPPVGFGETLLKELEMLHNDAGLSTCSVLRSATSLPARVFGFNDRGLIKSGMRSDLILVNGDPIANISNIRNIERVWVAGEEFHG